MQFSLLLLGSQLFASWNRADKDSAAPVDPRDSSVCDSPKYSIGCFLCAGCRSVQYAFPGSAVALRHPSRASDGTVRPGSRRVFCRSLSQRLHHLSWLCRTGQGNSERVPSCNIAPIFQTPSGRRRDWIWNRPSSGNIEVDKSGVRIGIGGRSRATALSWPQQLIPSTRGATAERARETCRRMGIHYLVARIYNPAWQDKQSWVWTSTP